MVIHNLLVAQQANHYKIYLPQKVQIAELITPPNEEYILDAKCLDTICKSLAIRWGVPQGKN